MRRMDAMLTSAPVYKDTEIPPQPCSPHRRAGTRSSVDMTAVNSAFALIFAITLMMVNITSSFSAVSSISLQCENPGTACHDENDTSSCMGNCTCELLNNGNGGSSYQCTEPPTAVSRA
uniref:Defensin n=1 Tax=Rhipicephalus appendiculatus TaxID=34631 RepID=A0A131YIX7_RHIAP